MVKFPRVKFVRRKLKDEIVGEPLGVAPERLKQSFCSYSIQRRQFSVDENVLPTNPQNGTLIRSAGTRDLVGIRKSFEVTNCDLKGYLESCLRSQTVTSNMSIGSQQVDIYYYVLLRSAREDEHQLLRR